jgi:dihydroorotate dehydrogenase (fumarate)
MAKDLTTTYLGLKLRNSLVVSSCPLTAELDTLKRMEELGAAAAVMPSLFEEQIQGGEKGDSHDSHLNEELGAVVQSFRQLDGYNRGPEAYVRQLDRAKKAVSIPLIASLNGTAKGTWTRYARMMQDAGADALELNMYYVPADSTLTTTEIEERYLELIAAVRATITIPLAVKVGPYFTAPANMAKRMAAAGANGLVLFNRFFEPDIDLATGCVAARFRFSTPEDVHLPLRWIALLKERVPISLAATGGIHSAEQMIKVVLAGADVGMVASLLYRKGIDAIQSLLADLQAWLDSSDFQSLDQMKGVLSQAKCPNPDEFERALYARLVAETTTGNV